MLVSFGSFCYKPSLILAMTLRLFSYEFSPLRRISISSILQYKHCCVMTLNSILAISNQFPCSAVKWILIFLMIRLALAGGKSSYKDAGLYVFKLSITKNNLLYTRIHDTAKGMCKYKETTSFIFHVFGIIVYVLMLC